VHGNGKTVRLNSKVYENSVIVRDSIAAMKAYLKSQLGPKNPTIGILRSDDHRFMRSAFFRSVSFGRSSVAQGYIDTIKGVLTVEDNYPKLFNVDHRFYLQAHWRVENKFIFIRWVVESIYDFEPFSNRKEGSYWTRLPIEEGMILKLPDGLSNYMVTLGIAKAFNYGTEWYENETI